MPNVTYTFTRRFRSTPPPTQYPSILHGSADLVEIHQGVEVEVQLGGDGLGRHHPMLHFVQVGHGTTELLSALHLPVAFHQEPAGVHNQSEAPIS